jgi:hypothetical protein
VKQRRIFRIHRIVGTRKEKTIKNDNKINSEIIFEENVCGSSEYSISVKITNISNEVIQNCEVTPSLIAGIELQNIVDLENIEITDLKDKKRRLINELEKQVQTSYSRQRIEKFTPSEKIIFFIAEGLDIYASIFKIGKSIPLTSIPVWAVESMKIDNWEDVERLEKEIILDDKEESFLRKSFSITKDKLSQVLKDLGSENGKFKNGIDIEPGNTVSFPFKFKAPHLFKAKNYNIQFKVTYEKSIEDSKVTTSFDKKLHILPSPFAIPTGGIIGGIVGYLIKATLIADNGLIINWSLLAGSILFGLVLSLLTARKPDSNKAITVEDFIGGFIIGALAGMFSDILISKLKLLL